jgi:hypothetical protein
MATTTLTFPRYFVSGLHLLGNISAGFGPKTVIKRIQRPMFHTTMTLTMSRYGQVDLCVLFEQQVTFMLNFVPHMLKASKLLAFI